MKKTAFFLTAIVALFMISCGESAGPVAIPTDVSNIRAESRPGAIFLQWDVPQERGYEHLWITWTDPGTQENMQYVVSSFYRNNSSFLVENTLQRHGEYVFTFRTVNTSTGTWSPNRQEIRAVSGRAPYILEIGPPVPVLLTVDMFSSSTVDPDGRVLANLLTEACSNSASDLFGTHWQQRWNPQWLQIDMGEEITDGFIQFSYRNGHNTQHALNDFDLERSLDGNTWYLIQNFSGDDLDTGSCAVNTIGPIIVTDPLRYLRISVNGTVNQAGDGLFHMSGFWLYRGTYFFFDPEAID